MKNLRLLAILFAVFLLENNAQNVPRGMVVVPQGTFQIGDPFNEGGREPPVETVYISLFYMDKYEVTKSLWDEVHAWAVDHGYTFNKPGLGKDPDHPVYNVDWYDAAKWCNARSEMEGLIPAYYTSEAQTSVFRTGWVDVENSWVRWNDNYRLPTKAEWEKAARGGAVGRRFAWADSDFISHTRANYFASRSHGYDDSPTLGYHPLFKKGGEPYTAPVGFFPPNGFGLHDMIGNMGEWCWDDNGNFSYKMTVDPRGPTASRWYCFLAGGGYDYNPLGCRVVVRNLMSPSIGGGFRTIMAPLTQWGHTIEVQPVQPTYSAGPVKLPGKDSLVVVTHGWQPAWKPVNVGWVEEMTNAITSYLDGKSLNNWQVHGHRWVEKARPSVTFGIQGAEIALDNARNEGISLGIFLAQQQWKHIHLIGHSAGSIILQTTCEEIKRTSPSTTVHTTFLDPFVGLEYEERGNYGKGADWSDNYFARDSGTGGDIFPFTQGPLVHAYNVDVTWLDPNKEAVDVYRSSETGELAHCYQTKTAHDWPYEFYLRTIKEDWTEARGFGFPLGKEGGQWEIAITQFAKRGEGALPLGTPDESCMASWETSTPSHVGPILDFSNTPTLQSETGRKELRGDGLVLSTGSPSWVTLLVPFTNRVNFVSLEAGFDRGTNGLLTVYWETNIVGVIDQRVSPIGSTQYKFPIPEIAKSGSWAALGLRLDSFSGSEVSVTVTNLSTGFRGIAEPFFLRPVERTSENLLVLQLEGPPGINYVVESSSNLRDWSMVAWLINTNGLVRFVDRSATDVVSRFYRALVP